MERGAEGRKGYRGKRKGNISESENSFGVEGKAEG